MKWIVWPALSAITILAFGVIANRGITEALVAAQSTGLPAIVSEIYPAVIAQFSPTAISAEIQDIKSALSAEGYIGQTVADQMGVINTVINGIVGVLNAFDVIARVAAGFGIVNTLYASREASRVLARWVSFS